MLAQLYSLISQSILITGTSSFVSEVRSWNVYMYMCLFHSQILLEVVEINWLPILDHFLKTEERMSILWTLYPGRHTWETLNYGKQRKEEKKKEGGGWKEGKNLLEANLEVSPNN